MKNNALAPAAGKSANRLLRLPAAVAVMLVILISLSLLVPINLQSAYAVPTSAQKQAEVDEALAKLEALEAEKVQMEDDYNEAVSAHISAMAAKEEAQERINAAQETIAYTQGKLGVRAANMYRNGPLSFLDVLFGATSFDQFATSWDILSNINNQDAELIQTNKEAREEAKAAREIFTAQEAIAAERLAEADAIMQKAEENLAAQAAEVANLEAEVADLVAAEYLVRYPDNSNVINNGGGNSSNWTAPEGSGNWSIANWAMSRSGTPYLWAGAGPDAFDCSGLVMWSYAQVGIYLGHGADGQYYGAPYKFSVADAQPGDILWMPGHSGIYLGGGAYIDALDVGYLTEVRYNMGKWQAAARY